MASRLGHSLSLMGMPDRPPIRPEPACRRERTACAQVTDRFGHASEPVTNTFTVDTIPPKFLSLTPAEGSVLTSPKVTIQGTVDDPQATVVLANVGPATNTSVSGTTLSFSFPVTLAPGPNTLTLTAVDKAGNSTTTTLHLIVSAVSVTVTSPASGVTIQGDSVLVTGTFTGPINTGITVNGVVAAQAGDRFYAQVPLQPGNNPLTVTATSPEGFTATQTLTVTSTGPGPIQVKADPTSGIGPLTVSFTVQNNTQNAITKIEADFDGNGTTDFTTTNPAAVIQYTYTTPGVYQASFKVRDAQNNLYTVTQIVVVQDAAQMDQMFRTIWGGMTGALAAGDKVSAMRYLSDNAQAKFGPIFDALRSNMPSIVSTFSAFRRVSASSAIGQYAVVRPDGTYYSVYLIYFVTDKDGVWRLDEM